MFVWPTRELKEHDKDFDEVVGSTNRLGFFILVAYQQSPFDMCNL